MPLEAKDLYSEAGQLFRHYLSWREKLLGGYLAIIAALAVVVFKSPYSLDQSGVPLSIVGLFLTIVFLCLDHRNTSLFNSCVSAGVALEKGLSGSGPFTAINDNPSKPTHTTVLRIFFVLAICVFLFFWIGLTAYRQEQRAACAEKKLPYVCDYTSQLCQCKAENQAPGTAAAATMPSTK